MELAIRMAREHGMGAIAVRNSTHYGYAGYFVQMAARENMIGLATSNARPCVAPTHGVEPMFGTNPIAFGAPADEDGPFLFDAATSAGQRGKLEVMAREGGELPEGWAIDDEGRPLTDPGDALERFVKGAAAFLPLGGGTEKLGGHKGYGIAIIMEVLSSALQNGAFLQGLSGGDREGTWKPYKTGHFFMAINVESFP